ncbi:MarR family transcriptional regulator [Mumia sp. zg.B17]|uniref:MarR family winged helix-turn-helix transcriptional regulator n=1 Tax=unclassified Mumia TaxID=2621872 RepID=UPI001C6DE51B|nr:MULTISPECIES: MarR family transcriptional regulator [unclassified Mumia]MBW9206684.1 MarR family transcriptional regulator [Mumia sp. zg.B17]MDD9349585.1 MarR family transcriptional regulator [Mumia sp.]
MSETHAGASEPGTENDIGWALGVLLRTYRDAVAPALGSFPHGPRGYQTMLEVLEGDKPSQLALANHLGIDRTVMTYLIDDLVEAGLVERRPNPNDRRQRQIVATDRGRRAVEDLYREVSGAERQLLSALDDDERASFRRLLCKAASTTTGDPDFDPCLEAAEA